MVEDVKADEICEMLEDTLNLGDLIRGGTQFKITSQHFQETDETNDVYPDLENEEEKIVSPWSTPFNVLISSMFPIGDDIYKRIVKKPTDNINIEVNCRVRIKYASYQKNDSKAVDSNFLRGDTTEFVIWDEPEEYGMIGGVVAGLVYAVKSMKHGEESHFIIPHKLLYGERGCPPRIRPKSDLLYIIQLISFVQVGDETAVKRVNDEDKHKYYVMIEKILAVKTSGIDYFKRSHWKKAAKLFHDAINSLDMCETSNVEEKMEKENHLIKLYTNIMICYNKMNIPNRVCSVFKDLSKITDTSKQPKALYEHGKALMASGDYAGCRDNLRKASLLKPQDHCINRLLRELDEKHKTYNTTVSNMWRKGFGNEEAFVPKISSEVTEGLKEIVSKLISGFEKSPNQTKLILPVGLSQSEINAVNDLIKDKKITLKIYDFHDKKQYYLIKNVK